ncbi:hypothetical protein ACFSC3_15690 [Sphingomonas floccifaciens]|uniref:Uncharacterized protein n=1 Tax=Sphingomonas floccifaciens TaxID=1844115 RepID=A0ABW4NK75_9SPHN
MVRTTGHATYWSNEDVQAVVDVSRAAKVSNGTVAVTTDVKPILLGRSIYYAALIYTGVLLKSLWFSIVLQALLVGAVMIGALRHFIDPADRRFGIAAISLAVALATTSLAWFTSMLMPDFLTGLAVVSAAVMVTGWQRETRLGRLFWVAVAVLAALCHSSHLLILGAIAAIALAVGLLKLSAWRPGAIALFAVVLVGICGESAFMFGVTKATGAEPIRPPFLTARLVEDGPGTAYLDAHCGESRFLLCRYRDRLPMGSDAFLWGGSAPNGVFKTLSNADQRRLAAEQKDFVLAVVADRPFAVITSSAGAILRQFGAWTLMEFNYGADDSALMMPKIPEPDRTAFRASRGYAGTMPIDIATIANCLWSGLGLIALAVAWRRRWQGVAQFGTVLTLGWIINTVICGAMSTPHDRYQSRIIWVLSLIVLASAARLWAQRSRGTEAPAVHTGDTNAA